MTSIDNVAFYVFAHIEDPDALCADMLSAAQQSEILGKVVIGSEGINGMIAGSDDQTNQFVDYLKTLSYFEGVLFKHSRCDIQPFRRLVVRTKPEIITMGIDDVDAPSKTAPHLPPEAFRDWIRNGEDMIVVDARNDYEYRLGTFKGAVDPDTSSFTEFPAFVESLPKDKKIVTFCTGGIRCEKATSWMLDEGFEDVYQLEGGVLNYFERIEDAQKDWDGVLFVFDRRVAIKTDLDPAVSELCRTCGDPRTPTSPCPCGELMSDLSVDSSRRDAE